MPDSRRTWAALAALYADNTAGAISPQDLRDGFASVKPHVASDAPTESDDETLGFDVGHAWIDTSTSPSSLYRCLDPTTGAAVWAKVYPQDAGGSGIPAAQGLVVVQHGDDGNAERPAAAVVLWRGSATPDNAVDGDLWDDDESWDS